MVPLRCWNHSGAL